MKKNILIDEAKSLPVEERAKVADSLLRSLNQVDSELDKEWAAVAESRLKEIHNGEVKPIPGEKVFECIKKKYK
ncbi:MAG: addiction module protein [bacterium]